MNENEIEKEETTFSADSSITDDVPEERIPVAIPEFDDEVDNDKEPGGNAIRAVISAREDIQPQEKYVRQKLPLRKAIPNFFYHYKTPFILTVLGIAVVVFLLVTGKAEPRDYEMVMYCAGSVVSGTDPSELEPVFEQLGEDIDGDGKVNVVILQYDLTADAYYSYAAAVARLGSEITSAGNTMLYITDKANFDEICEGYGDEVFESFEGGENWIPLNADKFADEFKKIGVSGELGISIVAKTEEIESNEEYLEKYNNAAELIRKIKSLA